MGTGPIFEMRKDQGRVTRPRPLKPRPLQSARTRYLWSHIRAAESSCSVFTGFAR
jgi:hypothetical protein